MKLMTSLIALTVLAFGSAFAQENYTQWTGSRTYVLNTSASGANVSADVMNFPVLVRLGVADSAVFRTARTGGVDLRFTKTDGKRLHHQREQWDSAGRTAAFWVLLDTVKGSSITQRVKLYWGKSDAADSSNGVAVFDTANGFKGVFHFSDAGDTAFDATANKFKAAPTTGGNSAGNYGVPEDTVGIIARARRYGTGNSSASATSETSGNFYTVLNSASTLNFPEQGSYTLSAWANVNATGASRSVISKGNSAFFLELRESGSQWQFSEFHNVVGWDHTRAAAGLTTARSWQHLVGVRNGAAQAIYVDGVLASSTIIPGADAGTRNDTRNVVFGCNPSTPDRMYRGKIDEVNIARVARSANWIKLSYESQKAAQTLLQVETNLPPSGFVYPIQSATYLVGEAIPANVPTVTGLVDSFTVAPALPTGLALNKSTGVISGTPSVAAVSTPYVLTAVNAGGSAKDTVTLTIESSTEVYANWAKHKPIWLNTTASGANVAANVLNFPVLVRFTSADSVVRNSIGRGADLRFTKANDVTRLPHQIEAWDSIAQTAAVWVLVDTVKASSFALAQSINVHVGRAASANRSSGAAVFDTANGFVAVWHMDGSGSVSDATHNGFAGTNAGATNTTAATGIAGSARGFNGVDQRISVPHNAKFNITQNLTISAWINASTWDGSKYVVNKGSGQNASAIWGLRDNTTGFLIFETGPTTNTVAIANPALNEWLLLHGTYGGGAAKLYMNGVEVSTAAATDPLLTDVNPVGIGRRGASEDAGHYFAGTIDEVSVSNALRSPAWVKLSYENQKAAQTLVSWTAPTTGIDGSSARTAGIGSLSVKALSSGMAFRVQGVEAASKARLSLTDMSGRAVWSGAFAAGMDNLVWNGTDNSGNAVPAGIYLARVTVKDASGAVRTLDARVPYTH